MPLQKPSTDILGSPANHQVFFQQEPLKPNRQMLSNSGLLGTKAITRSYRLPAFGNAAHVTWHAVLQLFKMHVVGHTVVYDLAQVASNAPSSLEAPASGKPGVSGRAAVGVMA